MRVVAGKFRGMPLIEFDGYDIRPTSDRAKESLFNILSTRIVGARFLDLFAGTGSIGIEALSRSAEKVVFVDKNKKSVDIINKNLAKVKQKATVLLLDAVSFVKGCRESFDIIFIDPPYLDGLYDGVLDAIASSDILSNDGIIIVEKDDEDLTISPYFTVYDKRRYGKAHFTFLRRS